MASRNLPPNLARRKLDYRTKEEYPDPPKCLNCGEPASESNCTNYWNNFCCRGCGRSYWYAKDREAGRLIPVEEFQEQFHAQCEELSMSWVRAIEHQDTYSKGYISSLLSKPHNAHIKKETAEAILSLFRKLAPKAPEYELMDREVFKDAIRQYREKTGLTNRQVARKAFLKPATLSSMLYGKREKIERRRVVAVLNALSGRRFEPTPTQLRYIQSEGS